MTYRNSEAHKTNMQRARQILLASKSTCKHCHNDFVIANFQKHQRSCLLAPENEKFCEQCSAQILTTNSRFCSRSCGATHSNSLRKKAQQYFTCLACGNVKEQGRTSWGLYCNNKCQQAHKWHLTKTRLTEGDVTGSGKHTLRKFVVERDGYECRDCGQGGTWNGKPLTLDMDHIDGDNSNNDPKNLRLLCPNCHTQTPTWGMKKR